MNPRPTTQTPASPSSINLFGVPDGTPYERCSDSALEQLRENVGRNGVTAASRDIRAKVDAVLTERRKSGVSVYEKRNIHHPV